LASMILRQPANQPKKITNASGSNDCKIKFINERFKRLSEYKRVASLLRVGSENFYFGFNPRINRTQVYELATRHFVRQRRDVLLVGPQHNRIPSWLSQRQDCPRSASNRCAFRPLPSQQWLALVKSSPQ
jgi:hypothetical protein